jgi:hypothetical protein
MSGILQRYQTAEMILACSMYAEWKCDSMKNNLKWVKNNRSTISKLEIACDMNLKSSRHRVSKEVHKPELMVNYLQFWTYN